MSTVRIQIRRGESTDWESIDPVLADGEMGIEIDTNKVKVGNNGANWTDLPYLNVVPTDLDNTLGDYVLVSDVGNAGGPAKLDVDGNLLVPKSSIILEGSSADAYETTLTVTNPTADRTITFPDATGTVALTSDIAELSQDAIDSALSVDTGMTKTYNDQNNTLELGVDPNIFATVENLDTQIGDLQNQIDTDIPATYAPLTSPILTDASFTGSVTGLEKSMVGLSNVENTSDADKPISDDTQDALNLKAPLESPTFTGTVSLPNGTISNAQVSESAAIEYSKLNLAGSIVSSDIVNGTITNEDISSTAAIEQSKISNLTSDLESKAPLSSPTFTGTVSGITKTMVGLGNVDNTSDGDKPISSATQSALDAKLDSSTASSTYAPIANPTFTGTVSGITASMIGLGSVDDTSDLSKPISTATQNALDDKLDLSGGTMTGALTLSADPSSSLHAATKQYVDNTASGIVAKPQVLGATTANIDATYNNGTAGVGATLTHNTNGAFPAEAAGASGWAVGKGILVKNQTNKEENGRYYISNMGSPSTPYVLTRCGYCDEASEIPGAYVFVQDGTNAGTGWIQVVADPATFTVGTDDIDVFQFSGSGTITAGTNISVSGNEVSVVATPSLSGVTFTDGTQTKEGVPSRTPIISKTANYTLTSLTERDSLIEVDSTSPVTITIPTNSAVAFPIGTTLDILGVNTGLITIAGDSGVTVNATPGLKLRTQWSSCTLFKRGTDAWVVYGDLKS